MNLRRSQTLLRGAGGALILLPELLDVAEVFFKSSRRGYDSARILAIGGKCLHHSATSFSYLDRRLTVVRSPFKILFELMEPLMWLAARSLLGDGVCRRKCGRSVFYVDEKDLEMVDFAVEKLRRVDYALYRRLLATSMTYIMANSRKLKYQCPPNGRYYVNDHFIANGVDGVIFAIVAGLMQELAIDEYGRLKARIAGYEVAGKHGWEMTRAWLNDIGFSQETIALVDGVLDKV